MKDVMLGLGLKYDSGVETSVDINASNVVEVHKSETLGTLWYHVGKLNGNTITWGDSHKYDDGVTPTVAMNDSGTVVELHQTQSPVSSALYYHVGTVRPNDLTIQWGDSHKFDEGKNPSVAMSNGGVVVEVHETNNSFNNKLWYHVGRISGTTVAWGSSHDYDTGKNPSVALNSSGLVVEVHGSQSALKLVYHVGRVNGDRIDWGPSREYQDGVQPSIALTEDGFVIEVHKSQAADTLWRLVGQVNGDQISWAGAAAQFDDGMTPSVATNGTWTVQTHRSEHLSTLWFSTSLIANRADWMAGGSSEALKGKSLKKAVMAASHDAGMYSGNILGRTQDQSLYGQLSGGIRYFDLRPDKNLNIIHGPVSGPPVQEVLNDVKRFMAEGHRELPILKFSHYDGFNDDVYRKLMRMIQDTLSPWLLPRTWSGRLADAPLQSLLGKGGKVLVVCDGDYPVRIPTTGIYVYRDWQSDTPDQGDLTVYDQYSDTIDYERMSREQLARFAEFDGRCMKKQNVPCDLFLLSWTLTPPTDVWDASKPANRNLGAAMAAVGRNKNGLITNLLYVDYFEYSRAPDVALVMNGRL